jgi:hypothetical protein
MCDAQSFKELKHRVTKLEIEYATHSAVSEEQLKMLFSSVQKLFWITCIFGGILLLTVVYGAIGEKGFNHVTSEVQNLQTITNLPTK